MASSGHVAFYPAFAQIEGRGVQCLLVGRTSTPRLRLGVLASQLVNIALKLHSEENKYISAKLKFNSASPR